MVTYYVKENELYTVTATVDCQVTDGDGSPIVTCKAGESITFKVTSPKIKLSDDNAAFRKTVTESSGINKEVTEHLDNDDIHITTAYKSKIDGAAQLTANNTFTGSNTFSGSNTFNQLTTFKSGIRSTYNSSFDNFVTVGSGINVLPLGIKTAMGADAYGLSVSAAGGLQLFGTHFMIADPFSDTALKICNPDLAVYSTDTASIGFDYANVVTFRSMPNDGLEGTYKFECWQWSDDTHTEKRPDAGVKLLKASQKTPLEDESVLNKSECDSLYAGLVGEIKWFAGSSIPSGWLLCDGSSLDRTSYSRLFEVIGTTWGSNSNTSFKLPNLIDRVAWGSSTAGTYIDAGLPNITGTISFQGYDNQGYLMATTNNGAFSVKESSHNVAIGRFQFTNEDKKTVIAELNASRSNSIYGKSSTVQPPAAKLIPIIKY